MAETHTPVRAGGLTFEARKVRRKRQAELLPSQTPIYLWALRRLDVLAFGETPVTLQVHGGKSPDERLIEFHITAGRNATGDQ